MARQGRNRGDATREALVEAAVEIFGRDGFHSASTRAIAAAAGVNQALIGFHFGGKQGLYMATIGHVMSRVAQRMGPLLQSIRDELDADTAPASPAARRRRYEAVLCRLTDAMVAMFTAEESRAWARLILREQQDPTEAFEVFYQASIGGVVGVLTELVARSQNASAGDPRIRLMVITIAGQALIFRAGWATAMRHLGVKRYGPAEVAAIQAQIRRNVAAILKAGVADE